MSEGNVEIVRRMYEAFDRQDAATALAAFDPDVVMDASHRVDGRVGRGVKEMTTILAEWLGAWEDFSDDIEEVRDFGDRVLVISTQRGRGKGSSIEWENRFGMVYELRNGRIVRWTVYDDLSKALEAARLSESS